METDLQRHIRETSLCDTHEHLRKEDQYLETAPDILCSLFQNYVAGDLISAGADNKQVEAFFDQDNDDIAARFAIVEPFWRAVQFTGYGEAVTLAARAIYDIERISGETLAAAAPRNQALLQPGERLRLLREIANLDHVQTDDFSWPCRPDSSGVEFFFYDLSWCTFCNGAPDLEALQAETGIEVRKLAHLRQAMEGLFSKYAAIAVAVKAQHAYSRTLQWRERSDAEAEAALTALLAGADTMSEDQRLTLGDWCWARGVELSTEYQLPFKIHTGYYAGNNNMPVSRIAAGNLCALLRKYPDARFVLMHIAYPYSEELIALAKHYRNVYVDLCWAWSIAPLSSCDFVRRYLHAAPANKLFIFGGDTTWAVGSCGYALQARQWFSRALQAEVADGLLTEPQAIALATQLMRDNQYDCFRIDAKRQIVSGASQSASVV